MSEKAISDAIAALAKSQLLTVDVLRQTQSTTLVMAESLGKICDQNAEILSQLERFGKRQNESERELRVVRSEVADVKARLEPIEQAYQAAQRASG